MQTRFSTVAAFMLVAFACSSCQKPTRGEQDAGVERDADEAHDADVATDMDSDHDSDSADADQSDAFIPDADRPPWHDPNLYIPPDELDRVIFRGNTQSYNSRYYVLTYEGEIFIRPNTDRTGEDGPWISLSLPPRLAGDVVQITWDDRFLMASNSSRELFQMNWGLSEDISDFNWAEYRGLPFMMGPLNHLPEGTIAWDSSVISLESDGFYTDRAGNTFAPGEHACAHTVVLHGEGRWISINDSWLPADFHYDICGPRRGAFHAVNMSASASTFFVINRYGDMFTMMWDFDMCASSPTFRYSYEDQRGVSNPARQLPCLSWLQHPKINGTITDVISIHQIGRGGIHRVMRVEGTDATGTTGYFEKDITELDPSSWVFHPTDHRLLGNILDNRPEDSSNVDLSEPEDFDFSRNMDRQPELTGSLSSTELTDDDWAAELLNFNCSCSPSTLRIHTSSTDSFDLILHHVHAVRLHIREGRGLDDEPWEFVGTIEVPQELIEGSSTLNETGQAVIQQLFSNQRFTSCRITATSNRVTLGRNGMEWHFE